MTTDMITVSEDASVTEIVTLLKDRRISAVPITDRFDVVLGIVSWTDLHEKIELDGEDGSRTGWWSRWRNPLLQWPHGSAAEVMSGPPLTIGADAPLAAVARVMRRGDVGRLLVVDGESRLLGIITRSDLLRIHDRLDEVIRDEVLQRVLGGTLSIPAGAVRVVVNDGVVTLTGRVARQSTAVAATELTAAVPGVTGVVDQLTAGGTGSDTAPRRPLRRPPEWGAADLPARRGDVPPAQAGTAMRRRAAERPSALSSGSGAADRLGVTAAPPHGHRRPPDVSRDIVEEWGQQSFPASDPPANW
ncbi:CBS domain-containing protein [Actinoplanes campanulatus]|nr:CBS domain-containing protein [Actinoplanes capillaceus]